MIHRSHLVAEFCSQTLQNIRRFVTEFNPAILKISMCYYKLKAWRLKMQQICISLGTFSATYSSTSVGSVTASLSGLLPLLTMSPLHSMYCPVSPMSLLYAACFMLIAWDNDPHLETDRDFLPPSLKFLIQSGWHKNFCNCVILSLNIEDDSYFHH